MSVVQNYTYDDGCEPCQTDTFMREPFVVMFSSKYTGKFLEMTQPFFTVRTLNIQCSHSVGILILRMIHRHPEAAKYTRPLFENKVLKFNVAG